MRHAKDNNLFNMNLDDFQSIEIESHEELFKILITEILINAVKHSIKTNPDIKISVDIIKEKITLKFQNSCYIKNQAELIEKRRISDRFGLSIICENIAKVFDMEFELLIIKENVANVKLIINNLK